MDAGRLQQVTARLEAIGVDAAELRALETEVAANERPPGFLGKLKGKVNTVLLSQWSNLQGECGETSEAFVLLVRRVKGRQPMSSEESDKVRAQLIDFVKVVPAGVFAAANLAFPFPGTGLLTPMLLSKMGLMPSRWRDAHVLHTLRKKAARLRSDGHGAAADELDALGGEMEARADAREEVSLNADLRTEWDANANDDWDEDEKAAYRAELGRLHELLATKGFRKRWFLRLGPEIWGPLRLSELLDEADEMDDDLLVCHDGRSGWVDLQDLRTGQSQV